MEDNACIIIAPVDKTQIKHNILFKPCVAKSAINAFKIIESLERFRLVIKSLCLVNNLNIAEKARKFSYNSCFLCVADTLEQIAEFSIVFALDKLANISFLG